MDKNHILLHCLSKIEVRIIEIVLKKITFDHFVTEYKNYYQDILVGEYQYIENGIEIANGAFLMKCVDSQFKATMLLADLTLSQ